MTANFETALKNLVDTGSADINGNRDENIAIILAIVEPLCETTTDDMYGTTLEEWLTAGDYRGNETPESIAEEWDALSD